MKTQFGASSLMILTALGLAACSGQIGDDTLNGGSGTVPGSTVVTDPATGMPVVLKPGEMLMDGKVCRGAASLASARISLLTDDQYTNSVRDAFGVTYVPESTKATTGEFIVNEAATVSSVAVAQGYYRAADQVASKIKITDCTGAVNATCLQTYLEKHLPTAWKRPVTSAEMTALIGLYNSAQPDGAQRQLNLVMEAALGSGAFLYRTEVGTDATALTGSTTLTPYELAAAVSFTLVDSVPDDALWKTAVDGSIAQPAVLSAQVDRLLLQPGAQANLTKKVSYYLNMEKIPVVLKDATAFPQYTATVQSALYDSAQKFLADVLWSGKFADLFTSNKFYANKELATLYGIPGVTGTQLVKVDLPAERNAGILTQPGLLATSNQHAASDDIVHRGLWGYNNLACGITIGAPPANAQQIFSTITGTERVRAQKRDAMAQCGACHAAFDPFGMVSEHFDAIGRYRTIDPDDMMPVVSDSEIKGMGADIDGKVSSPKDIADRLLSGRRASDCATVYLARFTLNHNPDVENSCEILKIKNDFASTGKFVDLFKAIVTSPAFLTRDLGVQ